MNKKLIENGDAISVILEAFRLAAFNPGEIYKVNMGDFCVEMKGK